MFVFFFRLRNTFQTWYRRAGPSQMAPFCCPCHSPFCPMLLQAMRQAKPSSSILCLWAINQHLLPPPPPLICPSTERSFCIKWSPLPCFYLPHLLSYTSSCTLSLLSQPSHSSVTTFRSLYPLVSALSHQLLCVTECNASAYSHWQLAHAGGVGEAGEGEGWEEVEKGKEIDHHPPGISPWLFLRNCRWHSFETAYIMQRSEAVNMPSGLVLLHLTGKN